uniref:TROVE domain-containing protein n=1 Tax=Scophthalmus maximus TaxID=52904 RepID=A0A8D3AEY2_SCOMX
MCIENTHFFVFLPQYLLLNEVCCSLVSKSTAPGQKEWDSEDGVWTRIINLAKDISVHDPEFLLKVAVYARQELNIRITSNFLLALAANQPSTKPHVRRYFCAAVQLPSDWLEVVRIYSACFSHSLPMCLKKAMADKFKQFTEYQLAKYNTRKHRCKHSRKGLKMNVSSPSLHGFCRGGDDFELVCVCLQLQVEGSKVVVDKKQNEFSMKKMIKRLHIKEPAEHVMAILGKKYPADLKAFTHSGIKGAWDRERSGQRMKLKEPETWERLLSREGNKAATWEKLIDNKSLPFMATLRNLRNMITQGISEAHHKKILGRLTNKNAVIQSRQFPFRFLAAYKVIMELQTLGETRQHIPHSSKSLIYVKVCMYIYICVYSCNTPSFCVCPSSQRHYTEALLLRYRKALETAVQISCRYNVPPLPGRTAVLLFTDMHDNRTWDQKRDFCLPPDPDKKDEEEEEEEEEAPRRSRRRKKKNDDDDKLAPSVGIDNIIVLSDYCRSNNDFAISNYRKEVNNKALVVQILLQGTSLTLSVNFVIRFVAERGSSRLMDHVEHLDKLYNVPPPQGAKEPQTTDSPLPKKFPSLLQHQLPSSGSRWRGVRVFVSSTFRDMHAERDILVRSVFPELRRRAAAHCLYLQEVELRWGVTEEESGRATELCLSEVCRSQMMVGILGERYGLVPPIPVLPDLPQYSWTFYCELTTFCGVFNSNIVLEIHLMIQFFLLWCLRSVPVAWRSDFVPESKEAESKMASLKSGIRASDVKVTENYTCEWGGVVEGKPYLKDLEDFGKAVLEDLWVAVVKQFLEVNVLVHHVAFALIMFLFDYFFFSYPRDLLSEFHSMLSEVKQKKPLVLIVDGVEVVEDGGGQLNSDWIPQQLPQRVCLVVSITSKAALLQTLAKKRSAVLFTLGQLTTPDRKEIVQKGLDSFGKKLSDAAFNNQVLLLMSASPLYLHLACEDLRNFLKESLQDLPQSLSQLVQHSLDRLCSQHRGMPGLRWTLAALTVSPTGKMRRGDEVYFAIAACCVVNSAIWGSNRMKG